MSITIGTLGGRARAHVDGAGGLSFDDDTVLQWWIGASDRWRVPAHEASVRQTRVRGAPVVETRVRVPGGDAVHRVYAVAGDVFVVEVDNDSSLPFALAWSRPIVTSRVPGPLPPADQIGLPDSAVAFGVAHRTTFRGAIGGVEAGDVAGLAGADAVAAGWITHLSRRTRLELPDAARMDAIVADRAEIVLAPLPDARHDSEQFVLTVSELSAMGFDITEHVDAVAAATRRLAKQGRWGALGAAARVMRSAGEHRAGTDIDELLASSSARSPAGGEIVTATAAGSLAALRAELVDDRTGEVILLPHFREAWRGAPMAVYDLATRHGRLSYAVRWHGDRPALLWELDDTGPIRIVAPALDAAWHAEQRRGEALLSVPPAGR